MAHWSDLPEGLMDLIMDFLEHYSDLARCQAVCSTWYNVAKPVLNNKLHHSLPWLLLPNPRYSNQHRYGFRYDQYQYPYFTRTLLNLDHDQYQKPITLHLRELDDRWISCTTSGWLLTVEMSRPYAMHLYNVLTREEVSLPGRATLKYPQLDGEEEMLSPIPGFIVSAAVSATPSDPKCTVLVIYGWRRQLALCRLGDDKWTHVDGESPMISNSNLTFHKPTGLFYALDNEGFVRKLELELELECPKAVRIASPLEGLYDFKYLVESAVSGDLWVVLRSIDMPDDDFESDSDEEEEEVYYTASFMVLRVDLVTKELTRVDSLGQEALFLGRNTSISVFVDGDDDHQGSWCRPNCIYFLDDHVYPANTKIGCRNMGVFDLATMRVEKEGHQAFNIENKQEFQAPFSTSTPFYWIKF